MVLVDDSCQLVGEEHAAFYARIVLEGTKGHDEVKLVVLESGYEVGHGRLADVDLHMRIATEKGSERLGHDARKREGDTDVEFSTHQVLQLVEPQQAVVCIENGLSGKWQQRLARLSEHHLMAVAVEEGLVEFILQLQNLVREGALSDEQFLGRSGEIECLCQLDKVFKLS